MIARRTLLLGGLAAGVGLGMVPRSAVSGGGSGNSAAPSVIELAEAWAQRDLQVCVRKRELLSGFAQALVDSLLASGARATMSA